MLVVDDKKLMQSSSSYLQHNNNKTVQYYEGKEHIINDCRINQISSSSSMQCNNNNYDNVALEQYEEQLKQIQRMQLDIHNTLNHSLLSSTSSCNQDNSGNRVSSIITAPSVRNSASKIKDEENNKSSTNVKNKIVLSPILSINSNNTPTTDSKNKNTTPFSTSSTLKSNYTNNAIISQELDDNNDFDEKHVNGDDDYDTMSNCSIANHNKNSDNLNTDDCYSVENEFINTDDEIDNDDDSIIKRLEQKYL